MRRIARVLGGMGRELGWLGTGELDRPRRRRLDVVAVVRRVAQRWHTHRGDEKVAIAVETSARRIVGRWDREHVRSIVGELLSNACKHAAGKPVLLRVAEGEAGALTLTVESAGCGALPRRPFARFVRGARARGEGMGVGLWLVDAIAKANGGSFTFRRTPRGGVRAVVTLASS